MRMNSEIAKLYAELEMKEEERERKYVEALSIYDDMLKYFSEKQNGAAEIIEILGKEAPKVLEELNAVMEEHEEYEKCHSITTWLHDVRSYATWKRPSFGKRE